eukprot:8978526-Pyramimonas_sp.AAC.1
MRQGDASDVFESIPVTTSTAVPLQPELSAGNRQHLRMARTIKISQQTEFRALDSKAGRT